MSHGESSGISRSEEPRVSRAEEDLLSAGPALSGEHTPAEERKKLRAVVVEIEHLAEQQARTKAERELTAKPEEMKGIKNFIVNRIWKHGLAREYYRQKEIAKAREEIHTKGNLYAAEKPDVEQKAHEEAMKAITDRFSSEYEQEMIHQGESKRMLGNQIGEQRPGHESADVKHQLKSLVEQYASTEMSDTDFAEAKKQVLHTISRSEGTKEDAMYADNFLEIAVQAKNAVRHGIALDKLDIDFDNIVLGKARDNVKTEAKYNGIDRAVEGFKGSRVGKFMLAHKWASEATIASAIAITAGIGAFAVRRATSSRLAAWGSFGATAVLGAGIIAVGENKRTKEDRAQHARERAQGRDFDRENSPRRTEMEKYLYDMRSASELSAALRAALYGAEGNNEKHAMTLEDAEKAMQGLADIEARIQLMDTQKIDLLAYSDVTKIERERQELDLMRAQAKVALRKMNGDADRTLALRVNAQMNALMKGDAGIEAIDARFKEMKWNRVWKAASIGAAVGVVAGVAGQEIAAYMTPDQTGFFEHLTNGMDVKGAGESHMTTLETLRGLIFSHANGGGTAHIVSVEGAGPTANFTLPEEMNMVPDGHGGMNLVQHGHTLVGGLHLDKDGALTPESLQALNHEGIVGVANCPDTIQTTTTSEVTANQYLENHPDVGTHVSRGLWYDNETPKPVFDENELKLWWGGKGNMGVDANDNYVFSVDHMLPGGSHHAGLSADAMKLAKEGHLKLLLSISEGTQAHPIEVDINPDGTVHIDPNSEAGKLLFEQDGKGHAIFKGRFAEVAEMMSTKDGTDHVRILATYEGHGMNTVDDQVTTCTCVPHNTLTAPSDYIFDPPPVIPFYFRTPLEPVAMKKLTDITRERFYGYGAGYGGGGFGLLDRNRYKDRFSSRLVANPELDVSSNDLDIVREYLGKQDKKYLAELESMNAGSGPMDKRTSLVITVPAYQEGKNIEKTIRSYAKMRDRDAFEIVILENHPKGVERDETPQVIERMRAEFPGLNIVHLYKVFDKKPAIGEVRKHLVDSVMLRKSEAGVDRSVVIASNDADLEDISENYARDLITTFETNKHIDAVGAKWNFPRRTFEQFPLLHASQRLWHYMDIAIRNNYLNAPDLIGRNSAFRSGMYAAIGGYNKDAQIGEDLEIGWLIKDARRYDASRVEYLNRAWLVSNPRRAVTKMLSGDRLVQQYGDFHVNEEVRKAPLDELLREKREFDEGAFSKEAQSIYDYYASWMKSKGGWVEDKYITDSFDRAMRFLGVRYRIDDNKVVILDTSKLRQGLEGIRPGRRPTAPGQQEQPSKPIEKRVSAPKRVNVRAQRIPVRPSAERRSAPKKLGERPNPTTQNRARRGR